MIVRTELKLGLEQCSRCQRFSRHFLAWKRAPRLPCIGPLPREGFVVPGVHALFCHEQIQFLIKFGAHWDVSTLSLHYLGNERRGHGADHRAVV